MIIVSQNGMHHVPYPAPLSAGGPRIAVREGKRYEVYTIRHNGLDLGQYETITRAKEVMEEIVKAYRDSCVVNYEYNGANDTLCYTYQQLVSYRLPAK